MDSMDKAGAFIDHFGFPIFVAVFSLLLVGFLLAVGLRAFVSMSKRLQDVVDGNDLTVTMQKEQTILQRAIVQTLDAQAAQIGELTGKHRSVRAGDLAEVPALPNPGARKP